MALTQEKERITRDIQKYLNGKHDENKKSVALYAIRAVPLATSYHELLQTLEFYLLDLRRYVARRNAQRFFHHSAGDLEKVFVEAIKRNQIAAQNEARMFTGFSAKPENTVLDWHRIGDDGQAYTVNGVPFSGDCTSVDAIGRFLFYHGIADPVIADYICTYAHQNGLFAAGHLFFLALVAQDVMAVPGGSRHRLITKTTKLVHCEDEMPILQISPTTDHPQDFMVTLDPPLRFVASCDIVDDKGQVKLVNTGYDLVNLDKVPKASQDKISQALTIASLGDGGPQ